MYKTAARHLNSHGRHATTIRHAVNARVLKKLKRAKTAYTRLENTAADIVAKSIKKAKTKSLRATKYVSKHPYATAGILLTSVAALGLFLFNRR